MRFDEKTAEYFNSQWIEQRIKYGNMNKQQLEEAAGSLYVLSKIFSYFMHEYNIMDAVNEYTENVYKLIYGNCKRKDFGIRFDLEGKMMQEPYRLNIDKDEGQV